MNNTIHLVKAYRAIDVDEIGFLKATHQYLQENPDMFSRKNFNGHVTGSAFVVNQRRTHALLLHHAKLQRWVQPGGHVEATDADVLTSAMREVREETGISEIIPLSSRIFDLDVHEIPENTKKAEPQHLHFDIRFLLEARSENLTISDESTDIQWVPLQRIDALNSKSLTRMTRKARIVSHQIDAPSDWSRAFAEMGSMEL